MPPRRPLPAAKTRDIESEGWPSGLSGRPAVGRCAEGPRGPARPTIGRIFTRVARPGSGDVEGTRCAAVAPPTAATSGKAGAGRACKALRCLTDSISGNSLACCARQAILPYPAAPACFCSCARVRDAGHERADGKRPSPAAGDIRSRQALPLWRTIRRVWAHHQRAGPVPASLLCGGSGVHCRRCLVPRELPIHLAAASKQDTHAWHCYHGRACRASARPDTSQACRSAGGNAGSLTFLECPRAEPDAADRLEPQPVTHDQTAL